MQKNRLLWLMLICAGLGALVWLDKRSAAGPEKATIRAARPAPAAPAAAAPSPSATPQEREIGNPLAALDKALLTDMVERPLFNSARKRPPPVQSPPSAPPPAIVRQAPASYNLLGVLTDGDRAVALLRKVGDSASLRVEVGDMVSGWRVAKVEAKSVRLERDDGTVQTVSLVSQ